MRRLAIIPARGGSKRIPGKNIRNFCGKPMISYILQAASESKLFDVIHVSTDSDEISGLVSELGFKPDFTRPSEYADDHTPIVPVLKYVTETYKKMGQEFDQIWLLMACAPLVESSDLVLAADIAQEHKNLKAVISVASYAVPVEWAYDRNNDGSLTPVQPGMFAVRSQDLGEKFYDTGSYVMFPTEQILTSEGAGTDTNFLGHVLSKEKAVDIDTEEDWKFAEMIYRSIGNKNTTKKSGKCS